MARVQFVVKAYGQDNIELRRLLLAQDKPVVLDEIWLPGALFKGLTAERLADYKGPMYGMFEAEFGVRMIRAEEKIRALAADDATACNWAKISGMSLGACSPSSSSQS